MAERNIPHEVLSFVQAFHQGRLVKYTRDTWYDVPAGDGAYQRVAVTRDTLGLVITDPMIKWNRHIGHYACVKIWAGGQGLETRVKVDHPFLAVL